MRSINAKGTRAGEARLDKPAVSVVIPTLNEEAELPLALARLRRAGRPGGLEIVVADGGSADGTLAVARGGADKVVDARGGRAAQMHAGALAASGDLLLFLHADTRLPPDWPKALSGAWASDPRPGATAFRLGFDSEEAVYQVISSLGNWRSRYTGIPHGDQAIACRREDYLRVGGFPPVALMEEYYLLPELSRLGPVTIIDAPVQTSVRRYERTGPLFNALRNAALIALFKAGVSPGLLAGLYRFPNAATGGKDA